MEFIPYKSNEILENKFYQIPQELFVNSLYKNKLNSDSKILYAFLIDRLSLSQRNNWKDADNNVYLIEKKLQEHLMEVDSTANIRFELLMKQFAKKENITKELKATNQIEWVGKMNAIKNAVEEIIFKELIYVQEELKMEDMKLYDIDSGQLSELIDSRRIVLRKKCEDYEKLRKQVCDIKENFPNILALLEDNEVESLNSEECKYLQKLLSLYSRMTDYEDREIFFLGARDNYFYFKNLELIKEQIKNSHIIKN